MRHLLAIMMITSVMLFSEETPVRSIQCSNSPAGVLCFSEKITISEFKLIRIEWEDFLKQYEYCYVHRFYGWAKVKTAKYNQAPDSSQHSSGTAGHPIYAYPFHRIKGDTWIVVTPTLSKEAHKK